MVPVPLRNNSVRIVRPLVSVMTHMATLWCEGKVISWKLESFHCVCEVSLDERR